MRDSNRHLRSGTVTVSSDYGNQDNYERFANRPNEHADTSACHYHNDDDSNDDPSAAATSRLFWHRPIKGDGHHRNGHTFHKQYNGSQLSRNNRLGKVHSFEPTQSRYIHCDDRLQQFRRSGRWHLHRRNTLRLFSIPCNRPNFELVLLINQS